MSKHPMEIWDQDKTSVTEKLEAEIKLHQEMGAAGILRNVKLEEQLARLRADNERLAAAVKGFVDYERKGCIDPEKPMDQWHTLMMDAAAALAAHRGENSVTENCK